MLLVFVVVVVVVFVWKLSISMWPNLPILGTMVSAFAFTLHMPSPPDLPRAGTGSCIFRQFLTVSCCII